MVVAQYLWTSFVILGGVFGLEELDLRKFVLCFFGWGKGCEELGSLSIMDKSLDENGYSHASNMSPFCCGERSWMNQHPH